MLFGYFHNRTKKRFRHLFFYCDRDDVLPMCIYVLQEVFNFGTMRAQYAQTIMRGIGFEEYEDVITDTHRLKFLHVVTVLYANSAQVELKR